MTGEFQAFEAKMRGEGLPDLAIRAFEQSFEALSSGESGLIAESDISPLHTLQSLDEIKGHSDAGQQVIGRTVVALTAGGRTVVARMAYRFYRLLKTDSRGPLAPPQPA